MPDLVSSGAILTCIQGLAPARLNILPLNRVMVEEKPAANIMDHIPIENIPSFGMCHSPANPEVAAATAAAMGVLTPMPCIPVIVAPWMPGAERTHISGFPALHKTSTCECCWGGRIRIELPGTLRTLVV